MGLSGGPGGASPLQPPPPTYDEQLGASFTQNFTSLAYNVTAIAQTDADGYGPAYLLNGLAPTGYWYQAGVSYHWPDSNGGYDPNFGFSYEVYNAAGKTTYPSGGGAGLGSFSGVVRSGDSVLLSLAFVGPDVVMSAKDWATGASASASYSSEGASTFVGDTVSPTDVRGFFTGLMTEWYHVDPYYGNEGQVTYSNDAVALTAAWMWIDEFQGMSTAPSLFNNQTQSPVVLSSGGQVQPFSADGASMYISAHEFVTGASSSSTTLTLMPATASAGGPSPDFLATYTFASQAQSAAVTVGVNVLEADPGTAVTVTITPFSSSEYWVFNGTSGAKVTFKAGTNATFVYYELAEQAVSYQVAGQGQALPPSSTPELTYEEPPATASSTPAPVTAIQVLGTTPVVVFAIVGSEASVGTIPGLSGERWAASAQNWTVSGPDSVASPLLLYQQYEVGVGYSVVAGGALPQTPAFKSTAFGAPDTIQLSQPGVYLLGWFDTGSNYTFTGELNASTSLERWVGSLGNTSAPSSIAVPNERVVEVYTRQFYAVLSVNDASGGSISPGSGWVDAGGNLSATVSANTGWQFESWEGSGANAYTGTTPTIEVTVTGPLTENATFYAGLAISADSGTDVAYSFGSESGSVQAGATKTLYVLPSSSVTLRASPSLFVYSFASWKGAGLSSKDPSLAVVVDSPTAVTGTSSPNYPAVLGAAAVAAVILILAISLWTRNRRNRSYGAFYPG
jgi:Divergent InlB B-repeat domain